MSRTRAQTEINRYMVQYARGLLERWGAYVERHMADQHGLPKIEAAYAARIGRGGGGGGHRVLCQDPPRPIWICSYHVGRLPEAEKEALHAWYVVRMKPDKTIWDQREKAEIMRISYGAFKMRVSRGTRKIANCLCGPVTPIDGHVTDDVASI